MRTVAVQPENFPASKAHVSKSLYRCCQQSRRHCWLPMTNGNPLRWTLGYQAIFALLLLAGGLIGTAAGYVAETVSSPIPTSLVAWIGEYPSAAGLWALVVPLHPSAPSPTSSASRPRTASGHLEE